MRSGALNRSNFYPRPPQGGRPTLYDGNSAPEAISIHALRKEGDHVSFGMLRPQTQISIHALRKEGDRHILSGDTSNKKFLSTPSARRATRKIMKTTMDRGISIHALRKEGDPRLYGILVVHKEFLSTPSARRATNGEG